MFVSPLHSRIFKAANTYVEEAIVLLSRCSTRARDCVCVHVCVPSCLWCEAMFMIHVVLLYKCV